MPDQEEPINAQPVDQPAEDTQTNSTPDEVEEQPEAQVETQEAPVEEAQAEPTQENIDMEKYWQERYTGSPQQAPVEDLTSELASLPTDEYGTVEPKVVADWFAQKLQQVEQRAEQRAGSRAEEAAMAILNETAQQQQLIEKYPEVQKDRQLLDTIFDLRDAAALKGQALSLTDAAARLNQFRQQAQTEGAQRATRTTQIQAAAHLETSAVKSDVKVNERQQTVQQALYGSGEAATNARRDMLKQMVQQDIEEGRITP